LEIGAVQLRSVWAPAEGVCTTPNIGSGVHYLIVTLITDTILLLTVLVGLLHLRHDDGGFHGFGQLLWKQGVIWLLFAFAAEIPPVVFIILNLNEEFDAMFQIPLLVAMTITATRMHRALVNFALGSSEIWSVRGNTSGNAASKDKWNSTVSIRFEQIDVTAHTGYEEYSTPRITRSPHSLYIRMDGQLPDKPPGPCL